MATDGGQIRVASTLGGAIPGKVYGEQNHSRTVTSSNILTQDKCIVASGIQNLALHLANKKGILITDINGNATFLEVPEGAAGYNKLLGTDANGNLTWIDR